MFRNQLINKRTLGDFDRLIDEDVWISLQDELIPVCRFCSEVFCNIHTSYFDIKAFTQYLIDQTDVRHSTMREYVIRLRRLDELLVSKNYPADAFSTDGVQQRLCEYLPDREHTLYRSALRKYDQYLSWQRHY